MARLTASEAEEFEELFRRNYAPLVRALAVTAGSVEDAADAVQDAFLQAYRHWDRIGRYDSRLGWLRRVAVNRIANQHRGRRRRSAALDRIGVASDAPAADELRGLPADVAALAPGQRLAVCLHYIADLSVEEIATAMDISPGTVKSQLHDARARLRPLLNARNDYG